MITELGNKTSPLWIIVHSPIENEFSSGRLFSSVHGRILSSALGSREANCFVTCLRERKNSSPEMIEARKEHLIAEAEKFRPNLVLLLGKEPLQMFEDKKPLQAWRGVPFESNSFPHKVMATFTPESARRQRYVDKSQHPGQHEAIFCTDVARALEEREFPELRLEYPDGVVLDNYSKTLNVLRKIRAERKVTSFDIEIIKPYSAHFMDCIGIANDMRTGYCIVFYRGGKPVFSPRQHAKILEELNFILSDSRIPKVAQNGLFDMGVLEEYYGMQIHNYIWDTMVAQQNLYCELPKDLGTLTSIYTNLPYLKHLAKTDRFMYCAMDAVSNLHVMQGQIDEMKEMEVLNHFQTITMPSLVTIHQMHREGINIDNEFRTMLLEAGENQRAVIKNLFNEFMPYSIEPKVHQKYSKFNPGSPQQKQFLLHEVFGCPIVKKYSRGSMRVTVDKSYLKDIIKGPGNYGPLVAKLLLKYSEAQKLCSSMGLLIPEDGRVHGKYGIGGEGEDFGGNGEEFGTLTGRLNCIKTDLFPVWNGKKYEASGRNLQNLMKGPERAMFIPAEGNAFVYCDLYAAEAFFVALDAEEPEMIAMLNRGEKLHSWMQELIREKYPAEYEQAGFHLNNHEKGYKLSKQIIHSLNYDVSVEEMSKNSGLPNHVCKYIYEYYHGKFPGIQRRQRKIKELMTFQRYAISPLGRKWQVVAPFDSKTFDPFKQGFAYSSQSGIGEVTQIAGSYINNWGVHNKPTMRLRMNNHDGLCIECPKDMIEETRKAVVRAFNIKLTKGSQSIIIPVEHGYGYNANEALDMKVHFYEF